MWRQSNRRGSLKRACVVSRVLCECSVSGRRRSASRDGTSPASLLDGQVQSGQGALPEQVIEPRDIAGQEPIELAAQAGKVFGERAMDRQLLIGRLEVGLLKLAGEVRELLQQLATPPHPVLTACDSQLVQILLEVDERLIERDGLRLHVRRRVCRRRRRG